MTEVLHANIFFIIASVGVVLFIFLVCIVLFHVIKIVRAVRRIVERIEVGSESVAEDLRELRASLSPARLISFIAGLAGMRTRRKRRTKVSDSE